MWDELPARVPCMRWTGVSVADLKGMAMRLEVGMMIRTNYGAGPFRITEIKRGCTCRWSYAGKGPGDPPHVHLTLEWAGPRNTHSEYGPYYLGGYDEDTLRSLSDPKDQIEILEKREPVQGTFDL